MTLSTVLNAVLYYSFQLLYLGHPSDILARLWLAHDIAHGDNDLGNSLGDERIQKAWKMFDESMRESYRTLSVLAGLIAAAISALFAIYGAHTAIRVLLLASLTSSIISAASCISLLSTVFVDPVIIEYQWKIFGVIYVIVLSGPSAWLSIALWTLQAALLAIVWLGEGTAARVVVTTLIGFRLLLKVFVRWNNFKPMHSRSKDFALGIVGKAYGMNHHMAMLTENTIAQRNFYLQDIEQFAQNHHEGHVLSRNSLNSINKEQDSAQEKKYRATTPDEYENTSPTSNSSPVHNPISSETLAVMPGNVIAASALVPSNYE